MGYWDHVDVSEWLYTSDEDWAQQQAEDEAAWLEELRRREEEAETEEVAAVTDADVQWAHGWAMYALGAPDSVCRNLHQYEGWYAACEADCRAHRLVDLGDVDWDEWEVGA